MSSPSETSPLLSSDVRAVQTKDPVDVSAANFTAGRPKDNGHEDGTTVDGIKTNGTLTEDDQLERQSSIDNAREAQFKGNEEVAKKLKYILPAVGVGIFLAAADQTIIVSSFGKIGSDLHELHKSSWIATSYLLTLTSVQPLYGKISDIFGRKPTLLFCYLVFSLGCLLCGLASSMDQLIAFRAFAGIGGGGMTTVVSIMMSDIVPLQSRGVWQGIINIIFAAGSGIGAPLGGFLADTIGWRAAFIGQVPLCLVAFVSCYFILDLPTPEAQGWKAKLRRIDFLGALTLISAITLLLIGLDRGSNVSWSSKVTITSLAVSLPMFLLFLFVELKVSSEPFAPGRIIFERSLSAAYFCNMFSFGGWFPVLFYIPLYFQGVEALSASQAGLRLVPAIICGVSGSLMGGLIMKWTGKYYWLNLGAYLLLMLSAIPLVMFTGGIANSTAGILVGLALAGLGNGTGVTTSLIALISNAAPQDQAIVTACSYLFRSLGSVLGIAAVSTLLQQSLRVTLAERLKDGRDVENVVRNVRESLDFIKTLPPAVQIVVRETYGDSLRLCFAVMGVITFGSFVASFFIREKKLGK